MSGTDLTGGWVTLPTGARIHYERTGRGDPVLLLHGIAGSSRSWHPLMRRLADRWDLIAIDLPGCGRSHKPDTDYSVGTQTASLRHALDALEVDLATVVGHSLGGALAMSFAYHYPERVGRLALIDSAALGTEMHLILRLATLPVLPAQCLRLLTSAPARRLRPALRALVRRGERNPRRPPTDVTRFLESVDDPATRRAFFGMLCSGSRISGQAVSALDRLGMFLFPMLIVWGGADTIFPVEHARGAAELVDDAELAVLDSCGHFPHVEAPDRLASILGGWLERTSPRRLDLGELRRRLEEGAEAART